MRSGLCRLLLLLACTLLAGCAGDTYAPVEDRTSGGGSRNRSYEVVRGDTLYSIAWRQGVDHRDLAAWNQLDSPDTIFPGQTLRLTPPVGGGSQRASVAASKRAPSTTVRKSTPKASDSRASTGASSEIDWLWPVEGAVLKAFSADGGGKQGINIGGNVDQDVKAAASGRVVYSGSGLTGYGNLIILKHMGDYLTAYGYNRELLVDEGAEVRRGQAIARMGRNGNRPMLHFELRREGRPVDPMDYLPKQR